MRDATWLATWMARDCTGRPKACKADRPDCCGRCALQLGRGFAIAEQDEVPPRASANSL